MRDSVVDCVHELWLMMEQDRAIEISWLSKDKHVYMLQATQSEHITVVSCENIRRFLWKCLTNVVRVAFIVPSAVS